MKTFPGNKKRVTSVFEVNYDYNKDKAWISYLMKYDSITHEWTYNDELSPSLVQLLNEEGDTTLANFRTLMADRKAFSPMKENSIQPILFKDAGEAE